MTQRRTFGADAGMSPDTIKAMPTEMTFDYFAVRLNGEKAAGGRNRLLSNKNLPGASDQASVNAHIDYCRTPKRYAGAETGHKVLGNLPPGVSRGTWR